MEHIRKLKGITEKEALEILAYDKAVENAKTGTKLPYDLTPQQEEISRQMRRTGAREVKKPMVPNLPKKERKPDATKNGIISEIFKFLTENCGFSAENVTILNPSRQISFQSGVDTFELTLTRKAKPKK